MKLLTTGELEKLFRDFRNLKVLVAGDVMVDAYWWGNVSRISPEAPVPVVSVSKKEIRPGGAGNVALNLAALGARPVLCSITGDDEAGRDLRKLLESLNMETFGLVEIPERKTTVKTRVIGNNHQLLRVDSESEEEINEHQEELLLKRIREILNEGGFGAVVIQDYNKGMLSRGLITGLIEEAAGRQIPVAVDPKRQHFMDYSEVTIFKPNFKELAEGLKLDLDKSDTPEVIRAACDIREQLKAKGVLLTLSENGILYCTEKGADIIPAHIRQISDVSGAGDTVISVAGLCMALGMDMAVTAWLSNLAGGLVCEYVGVVPVDKEQLYREALNLIQHD